MMRLITKIALLALAGLVLTGCGTYGEVEQGRTVAFDETAREVTFVKDSGIDDYHPNYTVLPPLVFKLPDDPVETGPYPKAGLRMNIDADTKTITMYNPVEKKFEKIAFEMVEEHDNVDVDKEHPLVYDQAKNAPRPFPEVNADAGTVTIYSKRQKILFTVKVPQEVLERYKPADWDAGDEVRLYFKEPGKSIRFMNISQTNIFKK